MVADDGIGGGGGPILGPLATQTSTGSLANGEGWGNNNPVEPAVTYSSGGDGGGYTPEPVAPSGGYIPGSYIDPSPVAPPSYGYINPAPVAPPSYGYIDPGQVPGYTQPAPAPAPVSGSGRYAQ